MKTQTYICVSAYSYAHAHVNTHNKWKYMLGTCREDTYSLERLNFKKSDYNVLFQPRIQKAARNITSIPRMRKKNHII